MRFSRAYTNADKGVDDFVAVALNEGKSLVDIFPQLPFDLAIVF